MRLEIEKFIEKDEGYMRRTKIICTIGPASCSEEVMRELLLAGQARASYLYRKQGWIVV